MFGHGCIITLIGAANKNLYAAAPSKANNNKISTVQSMAKCSAFHSNSLTSVKMFTFRNNKIRKCSLSATTKFANVHFQIRKCSLSATTKFANVHFQQQQNSIKCQVCLKNVVFTISYKQR